MLHCKCRKTGESIAVKCFDVAKATQKRTVEGDCPVQECVNQELRVMALLQQAGGHEHIVQLRGIYKDRKAKVWFVRMEYCDKGDLCSFIRLRGSLELSDAVCKFQQLVSAVSHLHQVGFAHLDLSMENILLNRHGVCKLCDFGLAQPLGAKLNTPVGKTTYMAPEVVTADAREEAYSPSKADIWSLGVILFTMLTGCFPFSEARRGNPQYDYFLNHGIRALVQSYDLEDCIPASAMELLEALLAVDPQERIALDLVSAHPFSNQRSYFFFGNNTEEQ